MSRAVRLIGWAWLVGVLSWGGASDAAQGSSSVKVKYIVQPQISFGGSESLVLSEDLSRAWARGVAGSKPEFGSQAGKVDEPKAKDAPPNLVFGRLEGEERLRVYLFSVPGTGR